jgi:hypothetical protein
MREGDRGTHVGGPGLDTWRPSAGGLMSVGSAPLVQLVLSFSVAVQQPNTRF